MTRRRFANGRAYLIGLLNLRVSYKITMKFSPAGKEKHRELEPGGRGGRGHELGLGRRARHEGLDCDADTGEALERMRGR